MADIPSSIIQPINVPQPVAPNPQDPDYSPTPALDALQNAYQKGVIGVSDIMKLAEQGSELGKTKALNAADIQQAKLRMGTQPAVAQALTAKAQEQTALVPSEQAATIAASKAATAESQAAQTETSIKQQDLNFVAKARSLDSSGNLSNEILTWRQNMGLQPIPTDENGDPDYRLMESFFRSYGINWTGSSAAKAAPQTGIAPPPPGTPGSGSSANVVPGSPLSQAADAVKNGKPAIGYPLMGGSAWDNLNPAGQFRMASDYYGSPSGQALEAQLKAKNIEGLKWEDAPDGQKRYRAPYQVQYLADQAPAPISEDMRKQQINTIRDAGSGIPAIEKAIDIVNNSKLGAVGKGMNEGSWSGQAMANGLAYFSPVLPKSWGDYGIAKAGAQNELMMDLAQRISTTIRSLAGAGNRVMQAEVNPATGLFYKQMPGLNSTVQVWNDWLNENYQRFQDAVADANNTLEPTVAARYGSAEQMRMIEKFEQAPPGAREQVPTPAQSLTGGGAQPAATTSAVGNQRNPAPNKAASKPGDWYIYQGKAYFNSGL